MTSAGRYYLLLTTGGRPVQHGWWNAEATARRKFDSWVHAVGNMPDPRVTLTDVETGNILTAWPDQT